MTKTPDADTTITVELAYYAVRNAALETALDEASSKLEQAAEIIDGHDMPALSSIFRAAATDASSVCQGLAKRTAPRSTGKPKMSELTASSKCPICGVDTPHGHHKETVAAWRADELRNDGWTSTNHKTPSKSGWYLGSGHKLEVTVDSPSYLKAISICRDGSMQGDFPYELLWFETANSIWRLAERAFIPRYEGSTYRDVNVRPKYWREITIPKATPRPTTITSKRSSGMPLGSNRLPK